MDEHRLFGVQDGERLALPGQQPSTPAFSHPLVILVRGANALWNATLLIYSFIVLIIVVLGPDLDAVVQSGRCRFALASFGGSCGSRLSDAIARVPAACGLRGRVARAGTRRGCARCR